MTKKSVGFPVKEVFLVALYDTKRRAVVALFEDR